MANIPTNSVYGYGLEFAQEAANTDRIRAGTQYTIMQTLAAKQQYDENTREQAATANLIKTMQARDAAEMAAKDSGNSNKDTPSINDDSVTSSLEKDIAQQSKRRDSLAQNAKDARDAGDWKNFKTMSDEAGKLDTVIRESRVKVMEQKRKDMEETANIMRDVNSQDGLNTALSSVESQFGKGARQKIEAQIPHDPNTLEPLWNDKTKQVVANYSSQFEKTADKMKDAQTKDEHDIQRARDQERKDHDRATEKAANANIGLRREGLTLQEKKETRLATSSEARIKNAAKKAEKAKDPNSAEAKSTAKLLESQLDMPPEISGKAAYDYLRKRAESIADGDDTDEAEQSALDYVTGKFSKGQKGEKHWFDADTPAKPATYGGQPAAKPAGGGNVVQFSDLK